MQFGGRARKSIRHSVFVGVLAGSVFAGIGAFATEPILISTEFSSTDPDLEVPIYGLDYVKNHLNGQFQLTSDITVTTLGTLTDDFGNPFTGEFDGNNFRIGGLKNPLFENLLNATIKNLVVSVDESGISAPFFCGSPCRQLDNIGILAKSSDSSLIINVDASGNVSGRDNVGGLVGTSTNSMIRESSYSGTVESEGTHVGGLVGQSIECDCDSEIPGTLILNSTVRDSVISGYENVGGLIGSGYGKIRNSTTDVQVSGTNNVGGLVGNSSFIIDFSVSSGTVDATGDSAGGISGIQNNHSISNSYSNSEVTGNTDIGGLVGQSYGNIYNSHASGDVRTVSGGQGIWVGGLVGWAQGVDVLNSYSTGNVYGLNGSISENYGGLIGTLFNANLLNSYADGDVHAIANIGALVGSLEGSNVNNSFAFGDVYRISGDSNHFSNFIGYTALAYDVIEPRHNSELMPINQSFEYDGLVSSKVDLLNSGLESANWAECTGILDGKPHLLALANSNKYEGTCPVEEVISLTSEKVRKELREVAETRATERIEKSVGFKNETPLPKSAPIAFVESTEKIDLTKVKAVEIAPTANVKVVAKAGEALQISLKSESKEPVELWVKSPDGTWLLAGVITFDENGKAILPPLQFKSAGDYSLVLSKPSADSSKGSAPLNQTGSLLVSVS